MEMLHSSTDDPHCMCKTPISECSRITYSLRLTYNVAERGVVRRCSITYGYRKVRKPAAFFQLEVDRYMMKTAEKWLIKGPGYDLKYPNLS
jgi:hypothetical protein